MGRPPCCDKVGIKKGPWTPEEDIILVSYIQEHGPGNWRAVPTNTGLMRCSKSCRLRWTNYLRPGIKRGNFTPHEEGMIIHLQALLGNKWAAIATYLPQRTDNDIKNYWNTHLKKKLKKFQPHEMASASPTSNYNQVMPYDGGADDGEDRPGASSVYASSEENISKLLEGWMRSSQSLLSFNANTITTINSDLMMTESRGHGFDKVSTKSTSIQCYMPPEVESNATIDRMIMIKHHHHDHDLESILSFDHCNGLMDSFHDRKSLCDSSNGGGLMIDHEFAQFDHKPRKLNVNNAAATNNPPMSFIDKWLLDESAGQVEGMMELPPIF